VKTGDRKSGARTLSYEGATTILAKNQLQVRLGQLLALLLGSRDAKDRHAQRVGA
jgi:hypothetical protein